MPAITVAMRTEISQLYVSLFGRAPDGEGLGFWVKSYSDGNTLAKIAQSMYETAPARAYYPLFATPTEVVTTFYTNVLGRAPDAEGLAFWVKEYNASATQGAFFEKLISNVVNYNGTDAAGVTSKSLFSNKVAVAQYYGEQNGNVAGATAALNGVTAVAATVDTAKAAIVNTVVSGQTFTLTTSIDNFQGTAQNDTFVAIAGTGVTSAVTDTIVGGAGTDTLKLFTDGAVVLPGTMTSIDRFWLNDTVHQSLDISTGALLNAGVTDLYLQNGVTVDAATLTVTGGAGQTTLTLDGITVAAAGGTVADGGFAWTTAAASTALTLSVNNVGATATANAIAVGITTANATTLNVVSTGTNFLNIENAGAGLTTLNISGSGALTSYTALTTGLRTVNASSATGAVTVDVSGVSARTVTGGSGADVFVFGANFIGAEASSSRDTVDGGAGRDTISMTVARVVAASGATQTTVTNTEILLISDAWTTGLDIDATKFTSVDAVTLTGATGTGTLTVNSGTTVTLAIDTGDSGHTIAVAGSGAADILNLATAGLDFDGATADLFTGIETLNINTGATVVNATVFAGATTLTPTAGSTAKIVATGGVNALTFTGVVTAAEIDASALTASTAILTVTAAAANAIKITGGSAADVINGSALADILTGGNGADTIASAAGNDVIILTETTAAIDKVTFAGGATAAATLTANGMDTITGFGATDTLNIVALGDGSSSATGLTTVNTAGAIAAFTDDTVIILNVAGTAGALTTGGTAAVTDFTNMTQVSAFLSERYSHTANTANEEVVIVWNVGTTSYIYNVDTLAVNNTVIAADEIVLVGTVTQGAALVSANLVYA